jgi:hypothetical protein
MGEKRCVYSVSVRKPERKRPLGRPRRRWADNTRWIFRKWNVGVWTELSWLRIEIRWRVLVNAVMNVWVP